MKKRTFNHEFKAKVAIEAIKDDASLAQIAAKYEISPSMVLQWKRDLLQNAPEIFIKGKKSDLKEAQAREDRLFEQVGRLQYELQWLKKKRLLMEIEMGKDEN